MSQLRQRTCGHAPKSSPVVLFVTSHPISTACLYTILPALPFHRDSRISASISLLLPRPQTDRSAYKLDWPQTQDFPAPGSSLRSQAWATMPDRLAHFFNNKKGFNWNWGSAWGELIPSEH